MTYLIPKNIFSITPSDTEAVPLTQYIMVGTEGDVAVETTSGDTGVLTGLQPGVMYPLSVSKVLATGTNATSIIGLS